MKRLARFSFSSRVFCLSVLVALGGCPPQNGSDTTPTIASLSDAEKTAISTGAVAVSLLSQATNVAQNPVGVEEQQALLAGAGDIVFGSCPLVTLGRQPNGVFTVTLQFGVTGLTTCEPFGISGYACSGTVGGTLDRSATPKTLALAFNSLTCNARSLGGNVSANYELSLTQARLEGSWNLTLSDGASSVRTNGTGTCVHLRADQATTISPFNGTIGTGADSWLVVMTDIQVSFQRNRNFIPFNGAMTISSSNPQVFLIRPLTVRFNANSPFTGEVEVSINGSAFFTVKLADLPSLLSAR